MRSLFFITSFLIRITIVAQSNDSLKTLAAQDWQTYGGWFNKSDTVVLVAHPIPDTIGRSETDKLTWLRENREREHILFDSSGALSSYYDFMECSVGETIYTLEKFSLTKGQVQVIYSKRRWNEAEAEKKEVRYTVAEWNKTKIVLLKRS